MEATLTAQIDKSYIWRSIDINKVRSRIDGISEKLNRAVSNIDCHNAIYNGQKSDKIPVLIVIVAPKI